jgi:hypothetical protein
MRLVIGSIDFTEDLFQVVYLLGPWPAHRYCLLMTLMNRLHLNHLQRYMRKYL